MRSALSSVATSLFVLLFSSMVMADANIVIKPAPPLPPPTGDVVYVSQIWELESQIVTAPPGRTIMVQPGNYHSTKTLSPRQGITIRGASGNRDDVVIWGGGMNNTGAQRNLFWVGYSDITFADLTLRDAYYHGIQIAAEYQTDRIHLYNVKILDCGERFIKGSTNNNSAYTPDDVIIEYCWLEQIQDFVRRPQNSVDPDNYIGGIDAMWCNRWIIRDCVFKNIRGLTGGARGGIFLWQNCKDTVVERNLVIGCDTGIAFGNPSGPQVGTWHMTNGIMRNNFIVRRYDGVYNGFVGIELCKTNNTNVYNNTMYSPNTSDNDYWRSVHINSSATTGLRLFNNILRGQIGYTGGASATLGSNLIDTAVQPSWFVEPLVGDLRLTSSAATAINAAVVVPEVTDDYFAAPRGSQPDIGGYEVPALPPRVTAVTPALATVHARQAPLDLVTIRFDKSVNISQPMVSVVGQTTGSHNDFAFAYYDATRTAVLSWGASLPNDTYIVTVNDAVTAGGLALDGEVSLTNPVFPSGNGTAGGPFVGVIYRLIGDMDSSLAVNVGDLQLLVSTWGLSNGQPGYDSRADLDGNNVVNAADLQILVANWAATIPSAT